MPSIKTTVENLNGMNNTKVLDVLEVLESYTLSVEEEKGYKEYTIHKQNADGLISQVEKTNDVVLINKRFDEIRSSVYIISSKLTSDGLIILEKTNDVYNLYIEWESSNDKELLESFRDEEKARLAFVAAITQ